MPITLRITPCLWFDSQGENAAHFYIGIFPNSRITAASRYSEAGRDVHGHQPGTAMMVAFTLDGCPFTALNGGPQFTFSEAISLQISCADQAEIDHYWDNLSAGGDPNAQRCGWLKDKFGLSWQVVPVNMGALLSGGRAMAAMMQMKKIDIAALERARDGTA